MENENKTAQAEQKEIKAQKPELRKNGTNEVGWKYTKEIVTKETITDFTILLNRRELRKGNITKLKKLLEQGNHFETPFVCNLSKRKYRLIDGNHRLEAIEQFFKKYPERRVEVGICYYENLSDEEEKKMYTLWNSGTKQTVSDFLKQYWDEIPITKLLEEPSFPIKVTPYPNKNTVEFKQLIGSYMVRDSRTEYHYRGCAVDFIEDSQQLSKPDVIILKEFIKDYITLYGLPNKMNMMYKGIIVGALFKLWYRNKTRFSNDALLKRLVQLKNHAIIHTWCTMSYSGGNTNMAYGDFLRALNGNRKINLLV